MLLMLLLSFLFCFVGCCCWHESFENRSFTVNCMITDGHMALCSRECKECKRCKKCKKSARSARSARSATGARSASIAVCMTLHRTLPQEMGASFGVRAASKCMQARQRAFSILHHESYHAAVPFSNCRSTSDTVTRHGETSAKVQQQQQQQQQRDRPPKFVWTSVHVQSPPCWLDVQAHA
ncbi:unnamed protein product [Polarella glacialis]|uniref:Secreted protein n=1 Tax=Polarella glacialis TaxID=89957 RepID=A0A813KNY7_POLGL|nr:unnamed protein product [Polarella glacialis]